MKTENSAHGFTEGSEQKDTDVAQSERMDQHDKDLMQKLSLDAKRGVDPGEGKGNKEGSEENLIDLLYQRDKEITSLRAALDKAEKENDYDEKLHESKLQHYEQLFKDLQSRVDTEKTSAIYWSKIGLEIKQILDTDGFDEDRMGLIREVFEKYS